MPGPTPEPPPELLGDIELLEEIGRGALGVVHRARSRRTGESFAVKLLHDQSPAGLVDLKREFRVAREIHHPGLVRLDTLRARGSWAALTMELVSGRALVESLVSASQDAVRDAFAQLASAVGTLHEHGFLHLDIKPTNVLRESGGRVVLLDFGLARSLRADGSERSGTPAYMAPERAARGSRTRAVDWWSIGVLLVECLTGAHPFPGDALERSLRQRGGAPSLGTAVPEDLRELVHGLLAPDPDARWTFERVAAVLHAGPIRRSHTQLVGRSRELALLDRVERGVVHVTGPGGIGKSALLAESFGKRAGVRLQARCHPDEHVSFNAIDGLVDAIVEGIPAPRLKPGATLAASFPVLGGGVLPAGRDPVAARRALAAELGELLDQAAGGGPLSVWLDDVHHADPDSTWLLEELLGRKWTGQTAWFLSYRPDVGASPVVERLRRDATIVVEPLAPSAVTELLAQYDEGADPTAGVDALGGSPYLVHRRGLFGDVTADRRARALGRDEADVANLVAASGAIPVTVLSQAHGEPVTRALLRRLEAEGLVRWNASDLLEASHDRVADELRGGSTRDESVARHARLAKAWEAERDAPPRTIARHLVEADRGEQAVPWYERAARDAEQQLAFAQAAADYEQMLAFTKPTVSLLERQARALDNAGRAARAAEAWQAALALEGAGQRGRDLRLLAGTRYLYAGRLEEGRDLIVGLLREVGVELPRWPIASALFDRALLAIGGFRERPGGGSTERVAALLGATRGLVMVEPVMADAIAVRALRESLRVDDPLAQLQTLGLEAVSEANVGGAMLHASARRLLERVHALASRIGTPFAAAWADLCEGCVLFFETRFTEAVVSTGRALDALRTRCVGVGHEINVAMAFHIAALACTGDGARLASILPELRRDASARGDDYSLIALHTAETYLAAIHEGRVEEYVAEADARIAAWPTTRFTSPEYQHMFATVSSALWLGRTEEAAARLARTWPRLESAGYLQLEWLGGQLRHLRARVWLRGGEDRGVAARVRSEGQRLAGSPLPGLRGLGLLLLGASEGRAGRHARRDEHHAQARAALEAAGMGGFVEALTTVDAPERSRLHELWVPR